MKNKFVAIGHITNDTTPYDHLGGGVSYCAAAAAKLGWDAHIITKCPPNHPYLEQLSLLGVTTHPLPSSLSTITTFQNIHDNKGQKTQVVSQQQEPITPLDLPSIPSSLLSGAIILVATVIGEVAPEIYPQLASHGHLTIAPSGYFRAVLPGGNVTHRSWDGFTTQSAPIEIFALSREDLTINGAFNELSLQKLRDHSHIVALTEDVNGSSIYKNDTKNHVHAFGLDDNEIVDYTGAGDAYAAAFITSYMNVNDIKQAAIEANLYAAVKLVSRNGIGIESIPSRKEVTDFIKKNPTRMREYLKKNEAPNLKFSFLE